MRMKQSPAIAAGGMQIAVTSPHKHFQPFGLACVDQFLVISDKFTVYITELAEELHLVDEVEVPAKLRIALPPNHITSPWRGLAAISQGGGHLALTLLEEAGQAVVEHPISLESGSFAGSTRQWRVGSLLNTTVRAVVAMDGSSIAETCGTGHEWGLYGWTETGNIVAFCPRTEHLQPVYTFAVEPAQKGAELLAMHIDGEGSLWLLLHFAGSIQLRVWNTDGAFLGACLLPSGRRWAAGLCQRDSGLVVAATEETTGLFELWHFKVYLEGDKLIC